jgi:4-amino-4-deoxy-L-arabinose transferase-like glycosyltransferase
MKWPFAAEAFAPLGYRPALGGTVLLPMYSPGLPMMMAVFEWLGGRDAVFYVVPLLGALAVWATYLMGSRLSGPWVGLAAAVLLAVSPTFLLQLLSSPMSDVPVAAWWALCLACALSDRRATVLISGLAGGAAILTRPNLVPLAAIPGALLLWRAVRDRMLAGSATQRLMLFAVGIASGCSVVAIINTRLWGSPLVSGYGSFEAQFLWSNLLPNLERYPRWTFETQTPAVLMALLAVFGVKRAAENPGDPGDNGGLFGQRATVITWSAFVACVYLSYLFYNPYDTWFYLRFMLPAYPPLFVLMVIGIGAVFTRMKHGVLATSVVVGIVAWHGWSSTSAKGIVNARQVRPPSVATGEYVKAKLPERALLVSMQQSGSIRYYSGRLTMRWDFIVPEMLEVVLEDVRRLGYRPYFVLEDWEAPQFQERFRQHSALGALDWPELARDPRGVTIYDPADKLAPQARRVAADVID